MLMRFTADGVFRVRKIGGGGVLSGIGGMLGVGAYPGIRRRRRRADSAGRLVDGERPFIPNGSGAAA